MDRQLLLGVDINMIVKTCPVSLASQSPKAKYTCMQQQDWKTQMMLADCFQLSDPKQVSWQYLLLSF